MNAPAYNFAYLNEQTKRGGALGAARVVKVETRHGCGVGLEDAAQRSPSQLLSHAQADLIGIVCNGCDTAKLRLAQWPPRCPWNLVEGPEVSMA